MGREMGGRGQGKQTNKQTKRVGVSALLDTAGRSGRASEGAAHDRCHAKLTLWIDPSIALETCYNNRPFPSFLRHTQFILGAGREKRGQFSKYAGRRGRVIGGHFKFLNRDDIESDRPSGVVRCICEPPFCRENQQTAFRASRYLHWKLL